MRSREEIEEILKVLKFQEKQLEADYEKAYSEFDEQMIYIDIVKVEAGIAMLEWALSS